MFVDLGTSVSHRPLALYGPSFHDSSLRRSSTQAGNAFAPSSPAQIDKGRSGGQYGFSGLPAAGLVAVFSGMWYWGQAANQVHRVFLNSHGRAIFQLSYHETTSTFIRGNDRTVSKKVFFGVPRATGSSSSGGSQDDSEVSSDQKNSSNTPFGYTRKDVLLIGVGVTVAGIGLKSGLEFAGVDPLQAGNVVQLVLVLGLTVGWISTYIFRVSNKDMTYAKQLRDYENKVMQKRLEGLTEAELEVLLEQVEEEKRQLASGEQVQ